MAEVSVASVVESLEGSLVKVRDQGLEDLRRLLSSSRNGNKLHALSDDGFHKILESIYRIIRTDRTTYLSQTASGTKTAATANKLRSAATALRLTVETGCTTLKHKTVLSVLDHIISTLVTTEDTFIEPLRSDYLKCFRAVLEYGPHGEHLRPKKWQELVDFVQVCITISIGGDDDSGFVPVPTRDSNSRSATSASFRTSQASTQKGSRNSAGHAIDDLLGSLCALSTITNMPLTSRASVICDIVVECLSSIPRAQELALETFNNVAFVLLTEDLGLLQSKINSLVRVHRHIWSSKSSPALRDQVLISLYSLRPLLLARPTAIVKVDLEQKKQLFSTLLTEYAARNVKDMLQFDDVTLPLSKTTQPGSPRYDFTPATESGAGMSNWTLLEVVATLVVSLTAEQHFSDKDLESVDLPRKRRKIELPVDNLMNQALKARGGQKLAALQVLFFLMSMCSPLLDEIGPRIADFAPLLLEDDLNVSNWSTLLFAKLVWSPRTRKFIPLETWRLLVEAARRSMTTSAKSRAGCVLLDAILQQSLTDSGLDIRVLQEPFVSGGKHGPAVLTDAALLMFTSAFTSNVFDQDPLFETAGSKLMEWLSSHWTLPEALDRVHNVHLAFHAQPEILCQVFAAVVGSDLQVRVTYHRGDPLPLARARAVIDELEPFISYLEGTTHKVEARGATCSTTLIIRPLNKELYFHLQSSVSELLLNRVSDFAKAWDGYSAGRLTASSNDIATILTTAFVVTRLVSSLMVSKAPSVAAISEAHLQLWERIEKSLGHTTELVSRLTIVATKLLRMRDDPHATQCPIAKTLNSSTLSMIQAIERCTNGDGDDDGDSDIDMMEPMDSHVSQRTKASQDSTDSGGSRRDLTSTATPTTFLPSLKLDFLVEAAKAESSGAVKVQEASKIIDEVTNMGAQDLVNARNSLFDFLDLEPEIGREGAMICLETLASKCFQDYKFERSEVALCFVTRVMARLAPLWANPEEDEDDLTICAKDIYKWLINTVLAKGAASPNLKLSIAALLDKVKQLPPSFAQIDIPSPRTSLLHILRHSPNVVKFGLSALLVHLFSRYILNEHEAIFRDIVENLPSDLDNLEGVAVRFYILAELGAEWYTILRHATYHLFETAANVPRLRDLGQYCVYKMSAALGLSTSRRLFELFAPQIFYTWLGDGVLSEMPYAVFQYDSISHLITENGSEVTAQIALRGGGELAEQFVNLSELNWLAALEEYFAQAEAYCLASQTSLPESEQLFTNSETRLRKEIGSDIYAQKLEVETPAIAAYLLRSLQDDRGIERAFEKGHLQTALSGLRQIAHLSASSTNLPGGQQPFFRAKYLIDELQWVCSQSGHTIDELWSPSVLVYLYRALLLTADPAVGPLHACLVLRKIKIVVSLGGSNATTGYPLEMLLYNLNPYLTLFQCSEDATGIYWYLLEKGKEYLSSRPSFTIGLAVSIFSAFTAFVRSAQDSTTQESHFVATMTRAQKFTRWLGEYLTSLRLQNEDRNGLFQEIVGHAKEMSVSGSNAASSHEGMLLICLLRDRAGPSPMLTEAHFDRAIQSLCKDFTLTPDAGDDIMASPDECSLHASAIKGVLRRIDLNENFRIWAAQVIGRACSVCGPDFESLTSDADPPGSTDASLTESASYTGLLGCLEAALWQDNIQVAAFAEITLQAIARKPPPSRSEGFMTSRRDFHILEELQTGPFVCPQPSSRTNAPIPTIENWQHSDNEQVWCSNLVVSLCSHMRSDPILDVLGPFASTALSISPSLVPYVIHLVLSGKQNGAQDLREKLSNIFAPILAGEGPQFANIIPIVLKSVMYLRRCRMPTESTLAHRNLWLNIDFGDAAEAATRCHLWHTAILCIEIKQAQQHLQATRSSRRSTQSSAAVLPTCLTAIYQSVDDPDFFYAAHHDADMHSVIQRLAHESANQKMLSFQSAIFDSMMRSDQHHDQLQKNAMTTVSALSAANMQSISQAVSFFASGMSGWTANSEHTNVTQTNQAWHETSSNEAFNHDFVMDHLSILATATEFDAVIGSIERGLLAGVSKLLVSGTGRSNSIKAILPLAMLSEAKDLLMMGKTQGVDLSLERMSKIRDWGQHLDFEDLSRYLDCREFTLGMIRRNEQIGHAIGVTKPRALVYEAKIICQSLQNVIQHDSSQFQLSRAVYLSELARIANEVGIRMENFAQYYLAKTISSHGEKSAAVNILRRLASQATPSHQDLTIDTSEILTELGQQVSIARLEPPDEIIANYLEPAYTKLKGEASGINAGRVFHLFAMFCDTQLQDPGNRDDYSRALVKRALKDAEVQDLKMQHRKAEGNTKKTIGIYQARAESWFKIYDEEYQQKATTREALIERCLENYLRSMSASDDFPNDKLRLLAIWLDAADSQKANDIVNRYIKTVPSWKFATLVNQLVSRLADTENRFQENLTELMFRISSDHPYHSLYQLFAVSKSTNTEGDGLAASRHDAAGKLTETILKKSVSSGIWVAIHNCSINFVRVAQAKLPEKKSKFNLRQLSYGDKLINSVEGSSRKIPPPAMKIEIRADKRYSDLPVMVELHSQVSIAGGVSAPKIATAVASDGSVHKMLLKAGNDDLRQDSIMEQVFEEVSSLLSDHRSTRQRKLGIRTYKVVPLVVNAGIIEFVQGTIPLHDFLLPAHERYFPKDYNRRRCRADIGDAEKKPFQQRVQVYRNVTSNFHPVMRFFFMENFLDPDEWFYKRLSYSRSTAAISILGHVLGLGDRHGHNILLDKNTGEVVHIDLGVAFEAGRILPVPEVVPFRLTRDLVDGMGVSGVEGVFRRCCNFTLEALRQDQESIMTLLDVLRYDPLVSWSISPYRLRKMQENADGSQTNGVNGAAGAEVRASDEPNEADRALTVVREKLGKSLSVEAEVNELIRQATDEKRLAVLFAGWGAYA